MDPIANMFSQIKNCQKSHKNKLVIPFSGIKIAILEILKNDHQISDYKEKEINNHKKIEISVDIKNNFNIKRISRPGRRFYLSAKEIPQNKRPNSYYIISTSQGIMKSGEAMKKGIGGEVIAQIL